MNIVKSYFQLAFELPYSMSQKPKSTPLQQTNPWLSLLHHFLDQQLSKADLSNVQLAENMQLSERQFYRRIRTLTGYTPNQYFTKYRMKKAYDYLKSGQYHTVKEVAYLVGYKKDSYFSKLFKQEFKESPLDLLRRIGVRKMNVRH